MHQDLGERRLHSQAAPGSDSYSSVFVGDYIQACLIFQSQESCFFTHPFSSAPGLSARFDSLPIIGDAKPSAILALKREDYFRRTAALSWVRLSSV